MPVVPHNPPWNMAESITDVVRMVSLTPNKLRSYPVDSSNQKEICESYIKAISIYLSRDRVSRHAGQAILKSSWLPLSFVSEVVAILVIVLITVHTFILILI